LLQLVTLNDLGQTLRRIDHARWSLKLVLDASPDGSASASSESALALIKAQLVSISNGLPPGLQVSVSNSEYATSRAELNALLISLDASRIQVVAQLADRRVAYENQVQARTERLNEELQALRSDLERAKAERGQLEASRDLALNTFAVLAKKVNEQRVAEAFAGREVQIASEPAVARPLSQSVVGARLVGLALGAILAAAFAWIVRAASPMVRRRAPSLSSTGEVG
jgi:hypothetical protein